MLLISVVLRQTIHIVFVGCLDTWRKMAAKWCEQPSALGVVANLDDQLSVIKQRNEQLAEQINKLATDNAETSAAMSKRMYERLDNHRKETENVVATSVNTALSETSAALLKRTEDRLEKRWQELGLREMASLISNLPEQLEERLAANLEEFNSAFALKTTDLDERLAKQKKLYSALEIKTDLIAHSINQLEEFVREAQKLYLGKGESPTTPDFIKQLEKTKQTLLTSKTRDGDGAEHDGQLPAG